MTRDLTRAQFERKARAYGMTPTGFLGYWTLGPPVDGVHVSIYNRETWRARLALLVNERQRHMAKLGTV